MIDNTDDIQRTVKEKSTHSFANLTHREYNLRDLLFHFTDSGYSPVITFGTFLRTVCTFCMFGAKEMVTWVFSVVASNIVQKAEALQEPPKPGRAGARGVDRRRNRSVYWENAVAWSGLGTSASDTQGKITVAAFAQLM